MRNLKRALSLVMAAAMLIGMMVISASAAGTQDFTDKDEIQHTEAVNTMVALNVINGKEDGSYYDPNGTLTRAEMAKIISFVMNGGVEPNIGTKLVPTYSDIDNHWAEAYIEYCTSMGIIAGDGAGKFNPGGTLTASQAAKMFLTAMGYNAKVFGLLGNDWETNTNRYANEAGLYDELSGVSVSQPITRDDAAQMAYNAIQSALMEREWSQDTTTGNVSEHYKLALNDDGTPSRTLFSERFGGKIYIGTFNGNSDNLSITDGYIQVYGRLNTESNPSSNQAANFPYEFALSNIGEQVKVLFKDGTGGVSGDPDKNDKIYGVYNTGNTVVYNTTKGDIQDVDIAEDEIKFGDTTYEYVTGGSIITNYGKSTVALNDTNMAALEADSGDAIKFICNDDGKIASAYITQSTFDVVAGVTSDKVQLRTNGTLTIADHEIYDGIAKDDVVKVTQLYDAARSDATFIVEKAETVTGTITKFFNSTEVAVDGTTISKDVNATAITDGDGNANYNVINTFTNSVLGDEYEFIMYGGRYWAAKAITESDKDFAIILAANDGDDINGQSVKLLLADGSTKTFSISPESNVGNTSLTDYFDDTIPTTNLMGTGYVGYNTLVSYNLDNDGKVDMTALTDAGAGNHGRYNKTTKSVTVNATNAYLTVPNAVAFVYYGTEWKVYDADTLNNITGTTDTLQYRLDSSNKVEVFAIQANAPVGVTTSDYSYLYITAKPNAYLDGDDTYTEVTGVDETGDTVTFSMENDKTADTKIQKGNFIQYKLGSDDKVVMSDIKVVSQADRVLEYDSGRQVLRLQNGGTLAVADDVVIISVDTADGTAGGGAGIPNADPVNTTYNNVVYLTDTVDGVPNTVIAVFVDVDGNIQVNGVELANTATASQVNALLGGADVTISGDYNLDSNNITLTGNTLHIDGKVTAATMAKVAREVELGSATTMNASAPAVTFEGGTVSDYWPSYDLANKLSQSAYTGSTSLAMYEFDLKSIPGFTAGTSKIWKTSDNPAGEWITSTADGLHTALVGNAWTSITLKLDLDGTTSGDGAADDQVTYTIVFPGW